MIEITHFGHVEGGKTISPSTDDAATDRETADLLIKRGRLAAQSALHLGEKAAGLRAFLARFGGAEFLQQLALAR